MVIFGGGRLRIAWPALAHCGIGQMLDAGRIAAWCWQGISAPLCAGLLLMYDRTQQGGWLLAAAVLGGFTLLVTLVLVLVLKPGSAAGR